MSNTINIPKQVSISKGTVQDLITFLDGKNLWNNASKTVINVNTSSNSTTKGIFAPAYTWVTTNIIKPAPANAVSNQTTYWFQQAPLINSDDRSTATDGFIRAETEYGLLLDGKNDGASQAVINLGLQTTSNYSKRL